MLPRVWTISHRTLLVLSLWLFSGCGSDGGAPREKSADSGSSPATSFEDQPVPGPQFEPPLPDEPSNSQTRAPLPVVDRSGFDKLVASHSGKVVLVDYWATWCPACRRRFPHTVALARQHQADGLVVIGVAMDDDDAHAEAVTFLTEQQPPFENVRCQLGTEGFIAFEIPEETLPCMRLYDRTGKILRTFAYEANAETQFTDDDVAAAVRAALAAK
jgi:thiol-disulfide isomerase/thioredoxin